MVLPIFDIDGTIVKHNGYKIDRHDIDYGHNRKLNRTLIGRLATSNRPKTQADSLMY